MQSPSHDEPRLVAAAERQMRNWAFSAGHQDLAASNPRDDSAAPAERFFIAIARQAGAGGSDIACRLGRLTGWAVYDRNLLDRVAARFHESRLMLDLVDETHSNWVIDVLGTWMDHEIVPHEKFVAHLKRVIATAAHEGKAIFVGRGAQFLLPRTRTLTVLVTAPLAHRIERIMIEKQMSQGDARQFIREADKGRSEFVKRFFHHDIHDQRLYDLVVDTQELGVSRAAEEIAAALAPR